MCLTRIWNVAFFVVLSGFIAGCSGGGPELGEIEGTVLLDGQPVDGATVLFQPDSGPSSYGITDSDGHYTLQFSTNQPGAVLGQHRVTIGTGFRSGKTYPESIPAKYNRESELKREVVAGSQTFDFDLTSD